MAIVEVSDSSAPFFGKSIEVGAFAVDSLDGNILIIESISEDGMFVSLHVNNIANPFKDAEIQVGATFSTPKNVNYEVASVSE